MNAAEVSSSSENGRQERNAADAVMLAKKFRHPCVVKLLDKDMSSGCGNGVGSTGGEEGIVGTDCASLAGVVGVAGDDTAGAADEVNRAPRAELSASKGAGWGSACLLCIRKPAMGTRLLLPFADSRSSSAG